MIIGIPKEIKAQENRVALVPNGARALLAAGHRVLVEQHAGEGSGFEDAAYREAGAEIVPSAQAVFAGAELIAKVKEPQPDEVAMLTGGHLLFTYLHLAPAPELTHSLLKSGCTAVAYETVEGEDGSLPLLRPMSQVAGRMAIQAGAHALEKHNGGRGVLLAGVPGVPPAKVVIIGGGTVGTHAAQMAVGLGADVVLLDLNAARLEALDLAFQGRLKTKVSNPYTLLDELRDAELVVGAVLVTGARAPHLVSREMLREMPPGAVMVDVAIDQGGCFETSRPTTHAEPTYVEEGIVHYCVANIPGAVPRTSTLALTNVTLPYLLRLANHGAEALTLDPVLGRGLNVERGKVIHPAVQEALREQN